MFKRKIKEGKHFKFEEADGYENTAIRLLKGEFKDIVYVYGGAEATVVGGMCHLKFCFETVSKPSKYVNVSDAELEQNTEFITLLGDILQVVIEISNAE
tara:strand:- start:1235 stop:1531 length:297 start_codon:yes stop_codon:yes gene_type:complete